MAHRAKTLQDELDTRDLRILVDRQTQSSRAVGREPCYPLKRYQFIALSSCTPWILTSPHISCTLCAIHHDQRGPWSMLTSTQPGTAFYRQNCSYYQRFAHGCQSFNILILPISSQCLLLLLTFRALDRYSILNLLSPIYLSALPLGLPQENASYWCCRFISFSKGQINHLGEHQVGFSTKGLHLKR